MKPRVGCGSADRWALDITRSEPGEYFKSSKFIAEQVTVCDTDKRFVGKRIKVLEC